MPSSKMTWVNIAPRYLLISVIFACRKGNMFASGIGGSCIVRLLFAEFANDTSAVDYGASSIVAKRGKSEDHGDGTDVSVSDKYRVESTQALAPGIEVGKRMPSTKVLNQSDARPWHMQELLPSNGRWRVVIFTGDISDPAQKHKLDHLGRAIDDVGSFLRRFTSAGARDDAVFELLAVHATPRTKTTIFDFPEVFRPFDEVDGYDYMNIYSDDVSYHEGHGKIYETFGISPNGCAVIIRPDQYVSFVGPMEDVAALNTFFAGFMIPVPTQGVNGVMAKGVASDCANRIVNGDSSTVDGSADGLRAQATESLPL